MTGLALLPPQETALAAYSKPNGLDPYLDAVRDKIAEFKASPPPVDTIAGRKQYRSMARKVSSFKTALDDMGKELVDELKDVPKKVDAERKRIRELLDSWRDDVKKPADDWDIEQERIAAEKAAEEAAKALAIQIESDHEIALLMYADHKRKLAEAQKEAERIKAEEDARIAKEAAERATKEAEEKAQAAILAAKAAEETAKREKLEAEQRAAKAKEDADKAAAAALAKAEQDKLDAIEAERKRVEAEKLEAERKQRELEKNRAHVGQKRKEAKESLMAACGLTEEQAKSVVLAIANDKIHNVTINY